MNDKLNNTVSKIFEYIDWYRAYDTAKTDSERLALIQKYSTEYSTLLLESKVKAEDYFNNVVDQPVYMTEDYLRLRKFLLYWYSSLHTLVKEELNVSDINMIDKPLLLESLGYDLWSEHSDIHQKTLSTELSDMYAKKGSPLVIAQSMSMLDISNFVVYEYWLTRNSHGELVFDPVKIEDMSFYSGFALESKIAKTFESVVNSDPHWYLTQEEIEAAEANNEIGLPSLTPYIGVVGENDWSKQTKLVMSWVNRIINDQFKYFLNTPDISSFQKYYFYPMTSKISLLEVYLASGYLYNELYNRTHNKYSRGSILDYSDETPSRYQIWPSVHQFDDTDLFVYTLDEDKKVKYVSYSVDEYKKEITFFNDTPFKGEVIIMGDANETSDENIFKKQITELDWMEVAGTYSYVIFQNQHNFVDNKVFAFIKDENGQVNPDKATIRIQKTTGHIYFYSNERFNGEIIVVGKEAISIVDNFYLKNFETTDLIFDNSKYYYFINNNEHNFIGNMIPKVFNTSGYDISNNVNIYLDSINNQYRKLEFNQIVNAINPINISISDNGNIIALSFQESPYFTTYRWNSSTNTYVENTQHNVIPDGIPTTIKVSGDGKYLVVAHDNGKYITSYKWDRFLNRFYRTALISNDIPSIVKDIDISYDGSTLVAIYDNDRRLDVYKWNQTDDQYQLINQISIEDIPAGIPNKVRLCNDDKRIIVAHADGTRISVYIWNSITKKYDKINAFNNVIAGNILDISTSFDGSKLAVIHSSGNMLSTYTWSNSNYILDNRYDVDFSAQPNSVSLSDDGNFLSVGMYSGKYIRSYIWKSEDNRYEKLLDSDITPTTTIRNIDTALNGKILVTSNIGTKNIYLYQRNDISNVMIESNNPISGHVLLVGSYLENSNIRFTDGKIDSIAKVPHYNGPETILYDETLFINEYNRVYKRSYDRDEKDLLMDKITTDWTSYGPMPVWIHDDCAKNLDLVNTNLKAYCDLALSNGTAYETLIDVLNVFDYYVRHDLGLTAFTSLFMLYDPIQENKEVINKVFSFFKPYQTRLTDLASYIILKDIPGDCLATKTKMFDALKYLFVEWVVYHKDKLAFAISEKYEDRLHFNKDGLLPVGISPKGPTVFLIDRIISRDKFFEKYFEMIDDDMEKRIKNLFVEHYLLFRDSFSYHTSEKLEDVVASVDEIRHINVRERADDYINMRDEFVIIKNDYGLPIEPGEWFWHVDHYRAVIESIEHLYTTNDMFVYALNQNFDMIDIPYLVDNDTFDILFMSNQTLFLSILAVSMEDGYRSFTKDIQDLTWSKVGDEFIIDIPQSEHNCGIDLLVSFRNHMGYEAYNTDIKIDASGNIKITANEEIEGKFKILGKDALSPLVKTYKTNLDNWVYDGEKYNIVIDKLTHGFVTGLVIPSIKDEHDELMTTALNIDSTNTITITSNNVFNGTVTIFNFQNLPWRNI